jgi:hypothetical protein
LVRRPPFEPLHEAGAAPPSTEHSPLCWISINPAGEIAGSYLDANNVGYGFVRAPGGTFTTFAVPGQGTGEYQGVVVNNNNPNGAVAGWYVDAKNLGHGFVRTQGGAITTFDPPGADSTIVTGLNPAGLMTGYAWDTNMVAHGFVAIPAIFSGKPEIDPDFGDDDVGDSAPSGLLFRRYDGLGLPEHEPKRHVRG